MATQTKKYKVCRRLGAGIYEKCQTQKFLAVATIGSKGAKKRQSRPSDYGLQLIEKQKVRFLYGIREKQFRNYVNHATTHGSAKSSPISILSTSLESRLDNTVYRLGYAASRAQARQLVSHGHFIVNGKKIDVPSYTVQLGDTIAIREGSLNNTFFKDMAVKLKEIKIPSWLTRDEKNIISAKVSALPTTVDPMLNLPVVLEFYSR
jgi:small subunit ribosomal protein S4